MTKEYDTIIVGAGVAGILAAILSARKGQKTLLVEAQRTPGGLLQTFHEENDLHFDLGTHLLVQTGIPELDSILYRDINSDWNRYEFLSSGHYINGHLDESSPIVNANSLKQSKYEKGVCELISNIGHPQNAKNCAQQLNHRFGHTFFEELFRPAVEKLFHTSADNLAPNSQLLFGLNRMKAFDSITSRSLKTHQELGDILSFHSYKEGSNGNTSFYPKQGGVGKWIEQLIQQYKDFGGKLLLNSDIEDIEISQQTIRKLTINNENISCSKVIWTAPLFHLLKKTNLLPESNFTPDMLDSHLLHLALDQPPLTKMLYYSNFDPDFEHFRVTLYSNLQTQSSQKAHRVTIEIFGKGNALSKNYHNLAIKELVNCGVFPPHTNILFSKIQTLKNSFPIYSNSFVDQREAHYNIAKNSIKNCQLFGKARGDIFFMRQVLMDVFNNIKL